MNSFLPVPDHQLNASLSGNLQGFVGLVHAPAGTVLPVDLKDLVSEAQPGQGRGGVRLHQLDKHSLIQETDSTFRKSSKETRDSKIMSLRPETDNGRKTKVSSYPSGGKGHKRNLRSVRTLDCK